MFTQTVSRALSRLDLDKRGSDPHPRQPWRPCFSRRPMLFASAD
jgi:hypothetical protein